MSIELGYLIGVVEVEETIANTHKNDNLISKGLELNNKIDQMEDSGFKVGYVIGSHFTLITSLPQLVINALAGKEIL